MVYNVDTLNMVDIGWTGENNATVISIDVKSWLGRWPDAQISLVVCRPKEDVFYPVVIEQKNHFAIWRVTLADVAIPGRGNAVLYAKSQNEDVIAKHPFRLRVNAALDSALKDPPEVGREWLEQVLDAADRAEAAQASYYTPKMDGYELSWEPSREGLPALPKTNIRGEKGETGVGVASIQQTHKSTADGGLNVWQATLTDGTQSAFTVVNGSKGSQGVPGERGPQGEPGIPGERGPQGDPGRGIRSIDEIKTSTEDGGYNMWDVIMTDGSLDARLYVRNGSKGSTGERGPAGLPGTSVSITSISQSTEDDGYSVVTFSDGKQLRVKNGSKGSAGEGGGGVMTVVCTPTEDGTSFTADKSFEEIGDALLRGQAVQAYVQGLNAVAQMFMFSDNMVVFSAVASLMGENAAVTLLMMKDGTNTMSVTSLGGTCIVNISTGDGVNGTADMTGPELFEAASMGQPVYANFNGGMYAPAQLIDSTYAVFRIEIPGGVIMATIDEQGAVAIEPSEGGSAGGGGGNVVAVMLTYDGNTIKPSHTSNEIYNLVTAGNTVLLQYGGATCTANLIGESKCVFEHMGYSAAGDQMTFGDYMTITIAGNVVTFKDHMSQRSYPNPEPLTINGTSYDGSEAVNIDIAGGGGGSEGVFELIATITPEAGTSTVNFTKESDGTACKYKSAMVRMSAAGHSNSSKLYDGSVNIYFNSGNTQLGAALVSELRVYNSAQSATAIAHTICGSWFVYNHGASGSSYKQVTVFPRDSGKYTTKDCPYITGVKLWFSGEIKSVEGDVIEIWGVRA